MHVLSQPLSSGPALLSGFTFHDLKSLLSDGTDGSAFTLRRILALSRLAFPVSLLRVGGPRELTELVHQAGLARLIVPLAGNGFCLLMDRNPASHFFEQTLVFRLSSGREEAIFVPESYAVGYVFNAANCLFMEFNSTHESNAAIYFDPTVYPAFALNAISGENNLTLLPHREMIDTPS